MKKLIIITVILISSLQTIVGQEKNELDLITSGKWYLDYMKNPSQEKTFPNEQKENNWMIFHPDGKHEVKSFGVLIFGKWEYSKDEKTIKMINNGMVSTNKIIKLNDTEMTLEIKQGDIEIMMRFKK